MDDGSKEQQTMRRYEDCTYLQGVHIQYEYVIGTYRAGLMGNLIL